jgi:N-dimethylarginine dimethylaminohydrolase
MRSFYEHLQEQTAEKEGLNSHNISYPAFVMCPPFNLSADQPNNVFMKNFKGDREVNRKKALSQFTSLYNFVANQSLVYLIPHDYSLQDQSFTANLGIVLPHYKDQKTVVISEFKSPPRIGEQKPGVDFFKMLKFDVVVAPRYFEGEADLKFINGNNYIGAYGIRTNMNALNWFEQKFNMNIVKVHNDSEELYHLDCIVYPLYNNVVMAVTSELSKQNIRDIEKFADIVDVPGPAKKVAGFTNCVGINKMVLCASNINELKVTDEDYDLERRKVDFLSKVCAQHSLEPIFFNMSEYNKNGADISCMFMHLNYTRFTESYPNANLK